MIRNATIATAIIALLTGCSSTRPTSSVNHKPAPAPQPVAAKPTAPPAKTDVRFLDQISSNPELAKQLPEARTEEKTQTVPATPVPSTANTAGLTALQMKYAALLGTEPTQIQVTDLLKSVDDWYGTRYKMGGESRSGIDCSAFVQTVYLSAFGMSVPRTAVEQFKVCNHISATEMREGDLVFFNTTGGVSHVGIYLRNNKFVHASVARGVTVSDLFDPYYLRRFLGVGRIEKPVGTR